MMKKIILLPFICLLPLYAFSQVGVGTTTPAGSLDVTTSALAPDGLLVPRVALAATNVATVITPTVSELVYNTFTSAAGPNQVTPGFYYWSGTVWIRLSTGNNNDWSLTGNAGTASLTNFIGTTDAQDFIVRTNNVQRFNFTSNGRLRSSDNGSALLPTYSWTGDEDTGFWRPSANTLSFSTTGAERLRIPNANQIHAMSLGTAALPFYSFSADTDIGLWSPLANTLAFSTNAAERMRLNATGQVLVNATTGFGASTFYSAATGNNNAIDGNSAGSGTSVYGQNTGSGEGVFGINNATGIAVAAINLGSNNAVYALHENLTTGAAAIYAESFYGNGYAVSALDGPIFSDNTFFGLDAFEGETDDDIANAVWGKNFNPLGTAILGGVDGINVFSTNGSGVAGSSGVLGVFGYAGNGLNNVANLGNSGGRFVLDSDADPSTNGTNPTANRATSILAGFDDIAYTDTSGGTGAAANSYFGGYFSGGNENGTPSYAYAGLRYNTNADGTTGTDFKIVGPGSNSTIIMDNTNTPRILFSPEAPEIVFQDFGVGKLTNGEARILIDPVLKESLYIDEKHPLKVYVTLEGECNGVYVTDKSANGFTVKELQGGTSNASFSWQIVANRADTKDASGAVVSKHVGLRLPVGPGPLEVKATAKSKESKIKKTNRKSNKKDPNKYKMKIPQETKEEEKAK